MAFKECLLKCLQNLNEIQHLLSDNYNEQVTESALIREKPTIGVGLGKKHHR